MTGSKQSKRHSPVSTWFCQRHRMLLVSIKSVRASSRLASASSSAMRSGEITWRTTRNPSASYRAFCAASMKAATVWVIAELLRQGSKSYTRSHADGARSAHLAHETRRRKARIRERQRNVVCVECVSHEQLTEQELAGHAQAEIDERVRCLYQRVLIVVLERPVEHGVGARRYGRRPELTRILGAGAPGVVRRIGNLVAFDIDAARAAALAKARVGVTDRREQIDPRRRSRRNFELYP